MKSYARIWNLAKWRFLQGEASLWLVGNKSLEFFLLVGIIILIYFDNFASEKIAYLKYLGLIFIIFSAWAILDRINLYKGYFDGYEQGFIDAATRNCDYWQVPGSFVPEEIAIQAALDEIEKNEKTIDETKKLERADEIKKGYKKIKGWIITWRPIKLNQFNA